MRFHLRKRMVGIQVPPYKRRLLASATTLGIILILGAVFFYVLDFRIRPTLTQLARVRATQIATQVINEAIHADISPDIRYQNLINLQFRQDGKVTLIQPNTGEINRIASKATLAVQNRLKNLSKVTIRIPVWQVMGSKIMAGLGPDIPVVVLPVGVVESSIKDQFESTGINQVRHRIFVAIKVVLKMVVPLVNQEVVVNTEIPLTEAVVMGDVPNIYVGSGGVILPGSSGK